MENLSKQDQEFIKNVATTNNATQSVKDAYGITNDGTARVKGSKLLTKDNIITAVAEVKRTLAERIPDELLERRHLDLLNKVDGEGNIDVQAISKGLDMGYKLKGAYAPEKNINLDIHADITDKKALELAQEYENKIKQGL